MKIYKVIMKGYESEENFANYSIEDTTYTYESKWYASREIAESHIPELLEIKKNRNYFGMPRILEQEIFETKQELSYSTECISRSNY